MCLFYVVRLTQAQLSGCPPLDSVNHGWQKGSAVTYDISSLPEPERTQADNAFKKWNTENTFHNLSEVTFVPAGAGQPADYVVQNGVPPSGNQFPADTTR